MSYILEALQEAQKHRDDTRVPSLKSVHVDSKVTRKTSSKWRIYLPLVAVLFAAGLGLSWWMSGSQQAFVPELTAPESKQRVTPAADTSAVERVVEQATPVIDASGEINPVLAEDFIATIPVTEIPATGRSSEPEAVIDNSSIEPSVASARVEISPRPELPPVETQKPMDAKVVDASVAQPLQLTQESIIKDSLSQPNRPASQLQGRQPDAGRDIAESTENVSAEQVAFAETRPLVQAMEIMAEAQTQPVNLAEEQEQQVEQTAAPVPHFRQLPFDVQQSLPKIVYSVHLYAAEPEHRMVKIDGRVRREGDTVKPGVVLEEITSTGAIFSFRDNVFRVPVNG